MKSPLKNKPLRLPGQSLDEKLGDVIGEKIMPYMTMTLFVIIIIILEWVRFYMPIKIDPVGPTVVGILFSIFFIYKMRVGLIEAKKIKQGRDGERVVGQELEELRVNGSLIFHDVIGPNFNIDHVVISPYGIFTIETKTWSKSGSWHQEINFDGSNLTVNGRKSDRDPITQSMAQANWLRSILKESTGKDFKIQSVILFPGWYVNQMGSKLARDKGVWLLSSSVFPVFLKNNSAVLSKEDLKLAAFHLARFIYITR